MLHNDPSRMEFQRRMMRGQSGFGKRGPGPVRHPWSQGPLDFVTVSFPHARGDSAVRHWQVPAGRCV